MNKQQDYRACQFGPVALTWRGAHFRTSPNGVLDSADATLLLGLLKHVRRAPKAPRQKIPPEREERNDVRLPRRSAGHPS